MKVWKENEVIFLQLKKKNKLEFWFLSSTIYCKEVSFFCFFVFYFS